MLYNFFNFILFDSNNSFKITKRFLVKIKIFNIYLKIVVNRHVVVLGTLSTSFAVILICIGTYLDYECSKYAKMPEFQISNFLIAIGTIMFAYGGHSALPTIQHDMHKPQEFKKTSFLAFTSIKYF